MSAVRTGLRLVFLAGCAVTAAFLAAGWMMQQMPHPVILEVRGGKRVTAVCVQDTTSGHARLELWDVEPR